MSSSPFSVALQLRTHSLAHSIIARHNTDDAVLDTAELTLLQRFCVDRSASNRLAILTQQGMLDEQGQRPGDTAAQGKGSLAGFLIARYGMDEQGLEDWEWEMLGEWFDAGVDGRSE